LGARNEGDAYRVSGRNRTWDDVSKINVEHKWNALEEIAGSVARANGPPVVGEDVEYAQHDDQEGGGPLGFEANRHHDTCGEPKDGDEDAHDAPGALEDKPDEQEYEQHTAGQLEAACGISAGQRWGGVKGD
jgi:hypothetical protein